MHTQLHIFPIVSKYESKLKSQVEKKISSIAFKNETVRHVNATKSYLHFDRFAGEAILCSNFFCFLLFLDVLFLS